MAWQLHYTSARSGRSGRAGFQFVAETPDAPPGLQPLVAPYMVYRPPPGAPLSPEAGDLTAFPVGFGYDRIGDHALLVRCRYLGQDYSGRYGNFFAHAVVAEPGELEGLRPIELWHSPIWAESPGDGMLPDLDDLPPGGEFAPDTLAGWLADTGAYDLLVRVADAVVTVLARGHGRVVLVCPEVTPVARWLTIVSYSLPTELAARMSFITYSAEPGSGPYRVVGTTPDVWESLTRDDAAYVIGLDAHGLAADPPHAGDAPGGGGGARRGQSRAGGGRFAHTVADCWRAYDFAGLDALGELALLDLGLNADLGLDADHGLDADRGLGSEPYPGDRGVGREPGGDPGLAGEALNVVLDRVAALLSLCRGDTTVTYEEEREVAGLLARHGPAVPDWVWHDLMPALPGIGFDLASTLCDWARGAGMAEPADRCAARCVVLALGDPALRLALQERLGEIVLPAPLLAELDPMIATALASASDLTEVARITGLAARLGAAIPGGQVARAAGACARTGAADLAQALGIVPDGWRSPLVAGTVAGLEVADASVRAAVLTPQACDRLGARHDWSRFPSVGLLVLGSIGRRHRDRRVEVTRSLVALAPALRAEPGPPAEDTGGGADGGWGDAPRGDAAAANVDAVLRKVWAEPPAPAECDELIEALGVGLTRHPVLCGVPARLFASAADDDRLTSPEVLRPAARLTRLFTESSAAGPQEPGTATARPATPMAALMAADAALVTAAADALRARTPKDTAGPLDRMAALAQPASPGLADRVTAFVARKLAASGPETRAELLALISGRARSRLAAQWIAAVPQGALQSKTERNELMVVALRLRGLGAVDPLLEEWARALAGRRLTRLQLEAYLRDRPELRETLRALAADATGTAGTTGTAAGDAPQRPPEPSPKRGG